jgi:predicted metal-binding membrane protein
MKPDQDTPRAAFDLLSWRVNVVIVVALIALSLIAWRSTIDQAHSMRAMVMGIGQIGYRNQGEMGAVVFLAMWITMMAAMMLPTIAPMVLAHHAVARQRGESAVSTIAFVAGYLLVWSAIGVVPLLAYWGFAQWSDDAAQSWWLPALAGTILIVAGGYQFTNWKRLCLDKCQSPFMFVARHDYRRGVVNALRAGVIHGALCLGCCWAMMVVLGVVGLMNLLWMVGIFLVFFVEKNWKHGLAVAKVAGFALIIVGVAVLAHPPLLALVSQ